jgi:hypothetical protein
VRDYTVFDFYLGESDDDAEKRWQADNLIARPLVGEKISIWSCRDERGNYVHKDPEMVFEGIVTRIEHTLEERGQNAQENHTVHFVEIFMKPVEEQ